MPLAPESRPPSAIHVAQRSIELQATCGRGAELLVRRRPPGAVQLQSGQREHMLMCSTGRTLPEGDAQSVLRTENGVQRWRRAPRGHVTFVPAGMPIDWRWSYHSDSIHLILSPSFLARLQEETGMRSGLRPLFRTVNEPLRQTLGRLREEAQAEDAGRALALATLTQLAGVGILRAAGAAGTPAAPEVAGISEPELRRALELIDDRLDESLSLEELARESGLSKYHFARAFKRRTGFPPHQYQLRRRIERARVLLREDSHRSVAEIASRLGFADESHLRRHFKRIVGTTPGRFRS